MIFNNILDMQSGTDAFEHLVTAMSAAHSDVEPGNMMRSPALQCNGKVFAFHARDGMGFRLGLEFDREILGLKNPKPRAEQALAFTRTH